MIRSFAQDKPPLQILSERENIYRLLSGTSAENLHKDHGKYTINPSTRYLHITHKKIREVYHLYDTDDAVNADFSIGSPQTAVNNKGNKAPFPIIYIYINVLLKQRSRNEKGIGTEMHPAIVSGIVTGYPLVSYWPIFFLFLVTVPEVFGQVKWAQFPPRFLINR